MTTIEEATIIDSRIPQEISDITIFLDYHDNDFSVTMNDAAEKLAEYLTDEISKVYKLSESISRTYQEWPFREHYKFEPKPKEIEKKYMKDIKYRTEKLKRYYTHLLF